MRAASSMLNNSRTAFRLGFNSVTPMVQAASPAACDLPRCAAVAPAVVTG